jgi:hypothetical protein
MSGGHLSQTFNSTSISTSTFSFALRETLYDAINCIFITTRVSIFHRERKTQKNAVAKHFDNEEDGKQPVAV